MRHFLKYFKPYLPAFILLVFFVCGQGYVNLILPDYTAKIVNDGISQKNLDIVWSLGEQMLLVTILGGLFSMGVSFLAAKISVGHARRLREAIFSKVESFSLDEFNNFSTSSLITRATNDIQQIQSVFYMLMRMTFLAPFMGIGAAIKANHLASSMFWIILAAVGSLIVVMVILFLVAVPKFTIIQKMVDKLGLQIQEMLVGVRVIRAYDKDREQNKKFDGTNRESTNLNIFVGRLMSIIQPGMTLIMGLASVAVVWLGAYLIGANKLNVGNVVALIQYVIQTIFSFFMLSIIFITIPRAAVSVKRIGEILSTAPQIKDPIQPLSWANKVKGIIEFKEVSFSYKGSEHPVLNNISFVARPGQTTAIIGSTGSGKSTLLSLILRLYDVTIGSVTLDGIDIRQITQHKLHEQIGYVPQKASLFFGTIKSNILYGDRQAKKGEIDQAATIAQATEFIESNSAGLEHPIAQGGANISGGQKQRLSIARALIKKAPIFLFDDSFSALDFQTDAALRRALKSQLKNATIIIVAQRISTIMQADNILVLENGQIVGQGRHADLLKTCRVYKEIAESQLSAAELNS